MTLRLGLVGCGRLAERGYAPAVARADGIEIVAVADLSRSRRSLLAAKLGASAHPNASELLAAGPLDGLIICSTPEHHEEAATQAAAAGVVALVEKPPAPDAAGALRLARADARAVLRLQPPLRPGGRRSRARCPPRATSSCTSSCTTAARRGARCSAARTRCWTSARTSSTSRSCSPARCRSPRAPTPRASAPGIALATSRGTVRIECATNLPYRELVEIRDGGGRRIARASRGGRVRGVAGRVAPGVHPLVGSLTAQLQAYGRALRGEDPGLLATAAEGAAVMCVLDAARRSDAVGGDTTEVERDGRQVARS